MTALTPTFKAQRNGFANAFSINSQTRLANTIKEQDVEQQETNQTSERVVPVVSRRPPTENMYDYDGACKPSGRAGFVYGNQKTFSVGIFKWVKKANGRGLKRTAVVKRIRGYTNDPNDVYRRAQIECDRLNAACG